jgi:hypothetical protein
MHPISKTISKYALVIRPTKDINFRNYPVAYFPVLITGSLCLYFNGFFNRRKWDHHQD